MTLEIRVRVANHHKDEARGILPDIRRCDSSFCSLLAGLAYPTYDGVLVLANRAEEAIRGAIARSGGKPPSGAHLIEGLVGGGMIPLDPTGARVEIVVSTFALTKWRIVRCCVLVQQSVCLKRRVAKTRVPQV
jgi:hypothetical protein